MTKTTWARPVGTILLAAVLLAMSGSMAWATAYEYRGRSLVPHGVSLGDHDMSRMTESEARALIVSVVADPLMRPVKVKSIESEFVFDPADALSIDIEEMLTQAYSPRRSAPFAARIAHEILGRELPLEVRPSYVLDEASTLAWLKTTAEQIDRAASDATLDVVESRIRITPEQSGLRTDVDKGLEALKAVFEDESALLAEGERFAELPVEEVAAAVTADSFGKTIVVDLSERRVRLFNGEALLKSYRCAIGKPTHPTPTGAFEITAKRYMPTWGNPGSTWAKDMPASIPPGPGNPLGTRALNLSASAIRFHGTSDVGSIGTAASHGCMRMVRHDIEDLYQRVEVGTPVYIVP